MFWQAAEASPPPRVRGTLLAMRTSRSVCLLACSVLLTCSAARVHAQACALHVLTDTQVTPSRGAERVALDASLEVRYPPGTDVAALEQALSPPDALIALLDEQRQTVTGTLQHPEPLLLRFVPDRPLSAQRQYVPLVARPGFDRPEISEYLFTTGDSTDKEPPKLAVGKNHVDISSQPLPASCGAAAGTYGVRVAFDAATDDADDSAIEYLLWLTVAAGEDKLQVVDRTRQAQGGRVELTFRLKPQQVNDPVCLRIQAIDGVGKSADNQPEPCFHPVQGSYFESGCSVAQASGRGVSRGGWLFLVAFGLPLLSRVANRCRRKLRFGFGPSPT